MKRYFTLLILVLASSVSATIINTSLQSQPLLEIISGNHQTAIVASTLEPFKVRLTENGKPLKDQIILFKRSTGDMTLEGSSEIIKMTDADGYAQVVGFMGRTAYCENVIHVTPQDSNQSCVFYCQTIADRVDSISVISTLPDSGLQQQVLGVLNLLILDRFQNPIRDCQVTLQLVNGDCFIDDALSVQKQTDRNGHVSAVIQLGNRLLTSEIIIMAEDCLCSCFFATVPMPGNPDVKLSSITASSPVLPDGEAFSQITVSVRNVLNLPLQGIPVQVKVDGNDLELFQRNERSDAMGNVYAELRSTVAQTVVVNAYVASNKQLLEHSSVVHFCADNVNLSTLNIVPIQGTVGQFLSEPLMVNISSQGEKLINQVIHFTTNDPGATFAQSSSMLSRTDSSGTCYAFFQLGHVAGSQMVYASPLIAPEKTVIFNIQARAGIAHALYNKFSDVPVTFTNTTLAMPLGVTARDIFQNIVVGETISFSALDGGEIHTKHTKTNAVGEAFTTVAVGARPGMYTFKAESENGSFALVRVQAVEQQLPTFIEQKETTPAVYHLYPNFPNPFNSQTRIMFDCAETVHVRVDIWDVSGRLVEKLIDETQQAGQHTVIWDASAYPSGTYMCRFTSKDYCFTRKMLYLR